MTKSARPAEKSQIFPRLLRLCIGAVLLAPVACAGQQHGKGGQAEFAGPVRDELLIGYGLLADTLSDESRLGTLDLFKTLTFNAPNDAIGKMMQSLAEASMRRGDELAKLRELSPDVSGKPTRESPIGDAIKEVAKEFGKAEMMSRKGGFDVRFVLLQAQATRMVAAMATATARFDPNHERQAWLKSVAAEYEGYRRDLIKYLGVRADPP